MATGSGTNAALYWVHGNHMGVPIVTTDATGAAVTPTGYTMPGFPGQLRTLAGLYYNRHRDYDSSTGRYIQADRIGLVGGSNLYLYAEANPLRYTDPDGRNPIAIAIAFCRINPAACATAGAGIGAAIYNWYYGPNAPSLPPSIPNSRRCEPDDDDDDEDPCEIQYKRDIGQCTSARIQYGKKGFRLCAESALNRRNQCKRGLHA